MHNFCASIFIPKHELVSIVFLDVSTILQPAVKDFLKLMKKL